LAVNDDDEAAARPGGGVGEGAHTPGPTAVGNQTMQVDALVEELEDGAAVPNDALAQILASSKAAGPTPSLPPPLPPKKVGVGTIAAGVVIVVLAAGGGIFFGMKFVGGDPAPAASTPDPSAHELVSEEDDEPVELEAVPIQLDEVAIPHPNDEVLEDEPEVVDEE
jgi:hypothetical protein